MVSISTPSAIYQELQDSVADFRILHLHAGNYDDQISAHLETVNRSDDPQYLALSYTWGSKNDEQKISLNQQDFLITSNCASALRNIRNESSTTRIWVDAICINQTDKLERSAQVGQMRDIYNLATRVILWLGDEDAETSLAFDLLTEISGFDQYDPETATSETRGSPSAWAAVESIFKRPYFARIWIVQEIALAKEITVLCGSRELSWTVFNRAIQWYYEDTSHISRSIMSTDSLFMNAVQLRNEWAMQQFGSGNKPALERLLRAFSHWKATDLLDKVNGLHGLSAEHNVPEIQPDYTRTILHVYSSVVKYIITRDRRLSILGQCQNPPMYAGLPSWVPDWTSDIPYRWQISEEYRPKLDAQVMMTSDGSILIPGSMRMPDSGYGTWQQDALIREEMNFDASLNMLAESHFPTSEDVQSEPLFYCPSSPAPRPEETMMLKGVMVDTVCSVTRPLFRPKEDPDDPVFFLEWERFALFEMPPGITCPYGGTFQGRMDSFWRTICTERIYLVRSNLRATPSCLQLFEQWRANLTRNANPAIAYVPDTADNIDTNDGSARSRALYNSFASVNISSPGLAGDLASPTTEGTTPSPQSSTPIQQDYEAWQEHISQLEILQSTAANATTMTMTTTTNTNTSTSPSTPGLREEFTVVNFARTLGLFCFARKLARTASGRLALVPEHTRPGDKVFVLYGASVPYILRELPNRYKLSSWTDELGLRGEPGAEYYKLSPMHKFIGEGYVHGIMDGEALHYPAMERKSRVRQVPQEFSNPRGVPELEALKKTTVFKTVLDPLTDAQEELVASWRAALKERERDIWFDAITNENY